jgi:DNA repair protein RecN (Recombination protein N)
MLVSLRIKNLALVEELSLELPSGYVAMTGETGAGKSVVIGGITLLLGERADRDLIRSGAESCLVEAIFDVGRLGPGFHALLAERGLEPCEGEQLMLKRTLSVAGANRQFVNGSPTTLQTLAELGDWLVDLHGPHDHQSLLHPARQLELLDAFGGLQAARAAFGGLVERRRDLVRQKQALVMDEAEYGRQLDLLRHQVREIEAARLRPEDEEELPLQHRCSANASRLLEVGQAALHALGEDDASVLGQAGQIGRLLRELQALDPGAESLTALHHQASAMLQELQQDLRHYVDQIEIDPDRLRELEERLDLIQGLKRKYGRTLAEVLDFGRDARERLAQLEGREAELERLRAALNQVDAELAEAGTALTRRRRTVIPRFRQAVAGQLADLGFQQNQFEAALTRVEASVSGPDAIPPASGWDRVAFLFSPNPGEPARPLRTIASSGEMARVMLALKTVLAEQDEVLLLIFDEVDANIGGEVAHAVGERMRRLGRDRQVLCITHLAQVAARATSHFVVTKSVRGQRTVTEVTPLGEAERVIELARMLGGQTESARRLAETLLNANAE